MTDNIEKKEEDVLLTPSEVWSVLEFSAALSGRNGYGYGNSMLTPDLISARLREINMNPQAGTQETIEKALNDPNNSEISLQEFSQSFEIISQPYKRLISFCANMLAFDLTYTCINAEKGDYTSSKYKKDFKIVQDFFDKFDYKHEFNVAVKEMLRNETFMFCPRMDGERVILQELPSSPQFTKITSRSDYGYLISLNMYWFLLPGVSLDGYLPFFRQKYSEIWGDGRMKQYNPMISPDLRGQSSWVFWQDLPPSVGQCWKLSGELSSRVPYFSGMFLDLLNQGLMRNLQKNINMAAANRLILGEVPLLKDANSKVKDAFAISAKNLGEFLALVKSSIGDAIRVSAVPLSNVQGIEFPPNNDMYQSYLNTSVSLSGVNTDLIFTSSTRPNIMATQLSLNVDEQLMETQYSQLENFLNFTINSLTKHFRFKFRLNGTKFFNNREQRLDRVLKLADRGIVLPQQISAAMGIDPFDFQRELEEGREMGFVDKLTPILQAAQMSAATGGRPQKSDSELSEGGSQTRGDGENLGRGGKI